MLHKYSRYFVFLDNDVHNRRAKSPANTDEISLEVSLNIFGYCIILVDFEGFDDRGQV